MGMVHRLGLERVVVAEVNSKHFSKRRSTQGRNEVRRNIEVVGQQYPPMTFSTQNCLGFQYEQTLSV